MRIVVDLNRCLGYAQCVPLAPEVLKLLRAATSSPVQAIIVDQLGSE
jgi:ferredoxin